MARRRVSKTVFPCGHKALGQFCHRCELAEKLEKHAKTGKKYITNKCHPDLKVKPKTWTKEELLEEAKRLKEDARKFIPA